MTKKIVGQVNEEFDILGLNESVAPGDGDDEAQSVVAVAVEELDPEDDRDNWPTITINTEEGKPNYETVIVHGTKKNGKPFGHDLQIMRGVEVKVPPSVVYDLRDAVATHIIATKDRDGKQILVRQDRPGVSWNLIDKGKYVK